MASTLSISSVICTVNRPDLIGAAVESVLASEHASFELLVIDQSKDYATKRALERFRGDKRLRYIRLDRVGLSCAYNAGIAAARAPLLAFTDDDCTVPTDWLSRIEQTFDDNEDVDLIYGQTLAAEGLARNGAVVPGLTIPRERRLGKRYGFEIYGMGANFALRRRLIDLIGGFDEALGGGGPLRSSQDYDFQFRAYRGGAVCLLAPGIWVRHYGLRTPGQWRDTLRAYGIGDGAFYLKHVRCGDVFALRLLVTRVARLVGQGLRRRAGRQQVDWTYLRSYLTGMRLSLNYSIDRRRRLYRLAQESA